MTRGGTRSTSGAGSSACRRPASSAAGTTSSCRPRWPTTRPCAGAGRSARLTIGPWTHASPGLFAETVRDGPAWFEQQLGRASRARAAGARARLRHGVATVGGVLPVATGGGGAALVPRARGGPWTRRRRRRRAAPTASTTTRTTRRRPSAVRRSTGNAGPQGPAPARAPPRRADLHQPGAHGGPHRHRPADAPRSIVRSSLEHTDFFVRLCDVDEKGQSRQPERRHRPPDARLGARGRRRRLQARDRHVAHRQHVPGRATASGSRSRAAPIRFSAATPARGEPLATGATLRSADQEVFHDAARPSSHRAARRAAAGGRRRSNGSVRPPRLVSRA